MQKWGFAKWTGELVPAVVFAAAFAFFGSGQFVVHRRDLRFDRDPRDQCRFVGAENLHRRGFVIVGRRHSQAENRGNFLRSAAEAH